MKLLASQIAVVGPPNCFIEAKIKNNNALKLTEIQKKIYKTEKLYKLIFLLIISLY